MCRRTYGVTSLAIVGVALLATNLDAQKPPKNPPSPPNLGGVLYFLKGGQVWQMNGNGSGKAAALPPGYLGRPSSCLYNGFRWWLFPKEVAEVVLHTDPETGNTTPVTTVDFELFAFRIVPDGTPDGRIEEVQLTDLPTGYAVKGNSDEIQWSNDGIDSFFSVLVHKADDPNTTDATKLHPKHLAYLYRFPTAPESFDPDAPPMMDFADGELVLSESDRNVLEDGDSPYWNMAEYAWSPLGTQIAYAHSIGANNYTLRIKTVSPALTEYYDVPLGSQPVEKLSNVSWSPDGEWICFYGWIRGSDGSLRSGDWTVRTDGSGLTQLYSGYSGYNGGKKWSLLNDPMNDPNCWVTYEDTGSTGIFLIRPDKSEGPYNLTGDLPTSKKNPEKRELIDWVSTTNVEFP